MAASYCKACKLKGYMHRLRVTRAIGSTFHLRCDFCGREPTWTSPRPLKDNYDRARMLRRIR